MTKPNNHLGFYVTPEHDCNYLPDKKSITLFADPRFPKNRQIYTALTSIGFRRSGDHIYQPYCKNCSACVSVRVDVEHFFMNRTQKRCWKRNQDLRIERVEAQYQQQHYDLYRTYMQHRHRGGGMEQHTPETYMEFLRCDWADTEFHEFYFDQKLICIAVIDQLDNALSAVYTFFDPQHDKRSLGRYAVLYQIELARKKHLKWVYLGYWIEDCRKMRYKDEYQPLEYYIDNEWRRSPA